MVYPENKTDRLLRLGNLKRILDSANKVYVWGSDDDCELFAEYITEMGIDKNIYMIDGADGIDEKNKAVVFLLTVDIETCKAMIQNLGGSAGMHPSQIIPPGVFWTYILAEKRYLIKPVDRNSIQFPVLATIDTVDMCNLDCVTCGRLVEHETGDKMSFDLFKKILDKLQFMGIKMVELYNYTEPFLNPDFYEFAKEVKNRGMNLGISSNLSLPRIKNLKEVTDLLTGGDWFVITISGLNQEIYEINHRRGKIANVIENIKSISQSSNSHRVTLRLLKFDYNHSEYKAAEELAMKYRLSLQWLDATGSPRDNRNNFKTGSKKIVEQGVSLNAYNKSYDHDGFFCRMIHGRNIVINCRGNVELCCIPFTRPYDLGSFLDQDLTVIQLKRDRHPICHKCSEKVWSQSTSVRRDFPQDETKISNVLMHGMDTLLTIRQLHPMNFYDGVKGTDDYVKNVIDSLL